MQEKKRKTLRQTENFKKYETVACASSAWKAVLWGVGGYCLPGRSWEGLAPCPRASPPVTNSEAFQALNACMISRTAIFVILSGKPWNSLTSWIFPVVWECDENARLVPGYGTTRINVKNLIHWGCATYKTPQPKKPVETPVFAHKTGNFDPFWGANRRIKMPGRTCRVGKLLVWTSQTSL